MKKGIKEKLKKNAVSIVLLGVLSVTVTGCISATRSLGIDTSSNKEQDKAFIKGDYNTSANLAVKDKDKDAKIDSDNLLPTLKAGNAFLYAKKYQLSKGYLDESENIIKYQREQIMLGSVTDYIEELQLNDAALEYRATMADSIMLNTYKAIDLMAKNDFNNARVELNRAVDRQRRAKEVYAKLIAKQKEAISAKEKEKGKKGKKVKGKKNNLSIMSGIGSILTKTLNDANTTKMIDSHYSNLKSFKAYPDFINPFTTYLAGLYFRITGDYSKSVDLLKEATGMMPKNRVVASDFAMVDKALSGHKIRSKYVWVIFENGLAPLKKEFKVNIPVFLVSNKVNYVGIALPEFEPRNDAYSTITVKAEGSPSAKTEVVAEMDKVFKTEFKYTYNDIVTRAMFSAVLKAYEQYLASKTSSYLSMAVGAFSALTTHADTRTWTTLPKDFQVARVKMPKNRTVQLQLGQKIKTVHVAKNAKNAIIYVRVPTAMSIPSISVINF